MNSNRTACRALQPVGLFYVFRLEVSQHLADVELRLSVLGTVVNAHFGVVAVRDRLLEAQQLLLL
jgi:hypothetical protein